MVTLNNIVSGRNNSDTVTTIKKTYDGGDYGGRKSFAKLIFL
jgi:hypothetical protein